MCIRDRYNSEWSKEINLPDLDFDICKIFVQFLYCGKLPSDMAQYAEHLLEIADKYIVPDLKFYSERYMATRIDLENVLDLIPICNQFNANDLKRYVLEFISKNINSLKMHANWPIIMKRHPEILLQIVDYMSH